MKLALAAGPLASDELVNDDRVEGQIFLER